MSFEPKNILVTGGAGFIGSNFIHYLLKNKTINKLINLDALTYAGDLENLSSIAKDKRYEFVKGNIQDKALITSLLKANTIDTVFHLAAESHVDRSIAGPAAFLDTNVVGTFTLLDAAKQYWLDDMKWNESHCRFHHVSTDEVYGMLGSGDPAFTELKAYEPNSPYSASKASSDHFVRAYQHTYAMPTTTSNCSNNYGPRQHPEKLIPTIITRRLEGESIPVYGDGSNIRDWLYVDDHCEAIWEVATRGRVGETYNIGGEAEKSNLDVVYALCDILDERLPRGEPHRSAISFVKDRPGHDWRYAVDISKIKNELGWQPKASFTAGLESTVAFYLQSC